MSERFEGSRCDRVILDSARRKTPIPVLARWLLGLGIAATLAANVAHGLGHGLIGAAVAWYNTELAFVVYFITPLFFFTPVHKAEPANAPAPAEEAE